MPINKGTTCVLLVMIFFVLSMNSCDTKDGLRGQQPPPEHQGIAPWGLSFPGSKCE
ncbi:hypothetical protein KY290_011631 [Solanum tuberosum]|uniref:Lipoprotein n=1 Tax=Solanum tuberosum TaxID=4113 RepID=A0ABQ7W3E1_SOLTU|nr:hypothetical protein KY284_011717 [Solanum tuberosum]KAH0774494.1 hypothetical protein KY290_011631 [Solanum tuberosum]